MKAYLRIATLLTIVGAGIALLACSAGATKPRMFFNITADPSSNPHTVVMALQLAEHAIEDGRAVVLFLNVKGVYVADKKLDPSVGFDGNSVTSLLSGLMTKGASVHVCPHCMKSLNLKEEDLISGVVVTDREKLFALLDSNTLVFSY